MIKSISILIYNPSTKTLQEIYRDFSMNWLTALEAVDEDVFIGADANFNMFLLQKNVGSNENRKLDEIGQYHLGELINRFRKGII